MADYPAAVYSPRTKENLPGVIYVAAKTTIGYVEDVTKLDDEVVATQTELGLDPKGSSEDVAERIKGIRSLADANADLLVVTGNKVLIKSADDSDQIEIYHNNASAYMKWSDGNLLLQTDEGVNTKSVVIIKGKGTGDGRCQFRAGNDAALWFMSAGGGGGCDLDVSIGTTFNLLRDALVDILCFVGAIEGRTKELKIYGFRTGDELRSLEIGVGIDAADTASFDGLSNYTFDGNVGIGITTPDTKLRVAGAIASASLTFALVGPTDDLDVSGVNTLFINAGANAVTIGGFVGGVDGQVLQIAIIDGANAVTLEHAEGGGNQDILLHAGADETLLGEYGGWTLVCHAGVDWHDVSHAKHV